MALASPIAPSGATHTFSTPLRGASHASHLPSGLSRPPALLGLPKKSARGISGASAAKAGVTIAAAMAMMPSASMNGMNGALRFRARKLGRAAPLG